METEHVAARLIEQGVVIPAPETVWVGPDVAPQRIAAGARICPGCRIAGAETSIGPDCVIGEEGPVDLKDCQLGYGVKLGSGVFRGTTFLDGAQTGSGSHLRPGTLLEEQASIAHTVGLKQTILMPYVVLGSMINLCDCLVSGGTSGNHHSEVGSGYVHFNFTPHQDKATASLLGDVPRGVLLDQEPIFLGGQGGLVGPVRIAFGTVVAAGSIQRCDVLTPGQLLIGHSPRTPVTVPYTSGQYGQIGRILTNNFLYIGNLHALATWYRHTRALFLRRDGWRALCQEGAMRRLEEAVAERVRRLKQLAEKMPTSLACGRERYGEDLPDSPYGLQQALAERWDQVEPHLALDAGNAPPPPAILAQAVDGAEDTHYLRFVQGLSPHAKEAATDWLQGIVDGVVNRAETALGGRDRP